MSVWGSALRDEKDISGCGIIGIMNESGDAFSGEATASRRALPGTVFTQTLRIIGVSTLCTRRNGLARRRRYNCLGHDPIFILSAFIPAYSARGGMGHSADFPVN
jgi:hypothetical protein